MNSKEYKVVMLPNKEGRKFLDHYTFQHLYFVSDEEIKEGDWIVHESHGAKGLHKAKSVVSKGDIKSIITTTKEGCWLEYCKKVIATTDKLLLKGLKDGYPRNYYVPTIPESYIKKYVEGNGKETIVRLEMEEKGTGKVPFPSLLGDMVEYAGGDRLKLKLAGNEVIIVETPEDNLKKIITDKIMEEIKKAAREREGESFVPRLYTKEDMIEFGKIARRSNGNIAMKEVFKEWEE